MKTQSSSNQTTPVCIHQALNSFCPELVRAHPDLLPLATDYVLHHSEQAKQEICKRWTTLTETTNERTAEDLLMILEGLQLIMQEEDLHTLEELDKHMELEMKQFGNWLESQLPPDNPLREEYSLYKKLTNTSSTQ